MVHVTYLTTVLTVTTKKHVKTINKKFHKCEKPSPQMDCYKTIGTIASNTKPSTNGIVRGMASQI